jgi:hypothetical protein
VRNVTRLEYLHSVIMRWRHTYWAGRRTPRFYRWMDEYNAIRESARTDWLAYCAEHRYHPDHDARDLLA